MKKHILLAVLFLSSVLNIFSQSYLSNSSTSDSENLKSAQIAMSNPNYPVTPGDIYRLMFVALDKTVDYFIPVDTTYKIRIANFAVLDVRGKTFIQLKKEVTDIVTSNYPMSGVQFILTNPSIFNVVVKGEVSSVREVNAWALSRVSDIIADSKTSYSS